MSDVKYVRVMNGRWWYTDKVGEVFPVEYYNDLYEDSALDSKAEAYSVYIGNESKWVLAEDCEPVIEHDGKFYREIERKAKDGELVIVVDAHDSDYYYFNGEIHTAELDEEGDIAINGIYADDNEYRVLEPVDTDDQPMRSIESLFDRISDLAIKVTRHDHALNEVAQQSEALLHDVTQLQAQFHNGKSAPKGDGFRELQHSILDADLPIDIRLHLIAELDAKQDELIGKLAQLRAMDE